MVNRNTTGIESYEELENELWEKINQRYKRICDRLGRDLHTAEELKEYKQSRTKFMDELKATDTSTSAMMTMNKWMRWENTTNSAIMTKITIVESPLRKWIGKQLLVNILDGFLFAVLSNEYLRNDFDRWDTLLRFAYERDCKLYAEEIIEKLKKVHADKLQAYIIISENCRKVSRVDLGFETLQLALLDVSLSKQRYVDLLDVAQSLFLRRQELRQDEESEVADPEFANCELASLQFICNELIANETPNIERELARVKSDFLSNYRAANASDGKNEQMEKQVELFMKIVAIKLKVNQIEAQPDLERDNNMKRLLESGFDDELVLHDYFADMLSKIYDLNLEKFRILLPIFEKCRQSDELKFGAKHTAELLKLVRELQNNDELPRGSKVTYKTVLDFGLKNHKGSELFWLAYIQTSSMQDFEEVFTEALKQNDNIKLAIWNGYFRKWSIELAFGNSGEEVCHRKIIDGYKKAITTLNENDAGRLVTDFFELLVTYPNLKDQVLEATEDIWKKRQLPALTKAVKKALDNPVWSPWKDEFGALLKKYDSGDDF